MDFMSERVADGRWFRILTVVDQFTWECLCLVVDQSLTGEKVAQVLEPVVMQRGAPSKTSRAAMNISSELVLK
jgi:putative transposase